MNPKDAEASLLGKAPLDYLEPIADEATARALKFGGDKYGPRNYTATAIQARVYVAAMRRHIADWLAGEDVAPDSGIHHLGHVAASCHVVLAAIDAGTLIDDRHEPGVTSTRLSGDLETCCDGFVRVPTRVRNADYAD